MEMEDSERRNSWHRLIAAATDRFGTPCYVTRWGPIADALAILEGLTAPALRVRSWLSFKTHPMPPLVQRWLRTGRGVEVVSECEFVTALKLGASVEYLLVNGVAKHAWLSRHAVRGLRVHFDSAREVDLLLSAAVAARWRVGVRCHAPDECDAREPRFGGQFGMTGPEAIAALQALRNAGADVHGLHFHLGQMPQRAHAYSRAVDHLVGICDEAGFQPRYLDFGGGLPTRFAAADALSGLQCAIQAASAAFGPSLEEIWLENGRFVTEDSTALAVRVLDVKERADSRYLICDGGRTNHALAADKGAHQLLVTPARRGAERLTTICGPTCMTDDVLARLPLPGDIGVGDVIAWMEAGAYHLPWETRFSHGLCAVAWCDVDDELLLARERERPETWADQWISTAA
jgi:diaminopimelate decarboxylase